MNFLDVTVPPENCKQKFESYLSFSSRKENEPDLAYTQEQKAALIHRNLCGGG